jgi:hypothetical protein
MVLYWLCAIGNVFKTCPDAAENEAGGKNKERRRPGTANKVANEVHGPNNQVNADTGGSKADGTGASSNRNRRIALQAVAFQLGWDIVMAHLVPGYMLKKTIVLAAGFRTNPLIFVYFCDNKYVLQSGRRPSSSMEPPRVRYQEKRYLESG